MRLHGVAAGLVLLAACSGHGVAPAASPAPADAGSIKLYVTSQGNAKVSVIDEASLTIDTTIDLTRMGFSAKSKPHTAIAERDGSAWYVTLITDGRVLKFDRNNRLIGQVEMETPGLMALDHAHDSMFVGRSMTAVNPPKSIGVIRRSDFTKIDEQDVPYARPHAIAVTHDGATVYSASLAQNRIGAISTATGRVAFVDQSGAPRTLVEFAISPDGRTMVASAEMTGTALVYDLTSATPLKPLREFVVGGKPWHPSWAPDGKHAYFPLLADNAVAEVDPFAGKVTRRFTEEFAQPHGSVVAANGKYLFISNRNTAAGTDGWVSVVDLSNGHTIKRLMLGLSPAGMGAPGSQ